MLQFHISEEQMLLHQHMSRTTPSVVIPPLVLPLCLQSVWSYSMKFIQDGAGVIVSSQKWYILLARYLTFPIEIIHI